MIRLNILGTIVVMIVAGAQREGNAAGHAAAMLVTSANIFTVNTGKILTPYTTAAAGSTPYYSDAVFRFIQASVSPDGRGEADFILDKAHAHYAGVKGTVQEVRSRKYTYHFQPDALVLKLHELGLPIPADFRSITMFEGDRSEPAVFKRVESGTVGTDCLGQSGEKAARCFFAYALPVFPLNEEEKKLDPTKVSYRFATPARSISIQIGSRTEIEKFKAQLLSGNDAQAGADLDVLHFHSIPLRVTVYPIDPEQDEEEILRQLVGSGQPFHLPDIRGHYLRWHKSVQKGYVLKPSSNAVEYDSMESMPDHGNGMSEKSKDRKLVAVNRISMVEQSKGLSNVEIDAPSFLQMVVAPAIQGITKQGEVINLKCIVPVSGRDSGRACMKKTMDGKETTVIIGQLPLDANKTVPTKSMMTFFVRNDFDLFLVKIDRDPVPFVPPLKPGTKAVTVVPAGDRGLGLGPIPPPGK